MVCSLRKVHLKTFYRLHKCIQIVNISFYLLFNRHWSIDLIKKHWKDCYLYLFMFIFIYVSSHGTSPCAVSRHGAVCSSSTPHHRSIPLTQHSHEDSALDTRASNDPSVFTITEKAPTRAFSWLKAPTCTFTFKTLLRHCDKTLWFKTQCPSLMTFHQFINLCLLTFYLLRICET